MERIPTSAPVLGESEATAVLDAVRSTEISGLSGLRIAEFEELFARYCGVRHGVATSSGTSALHLATNALGVKPGDEVLVSTLTNMATFFSVLYQGGRPVPIDVESDTANLNPLLLEQALSPRTVGVIVVHLFGHPADMQPIEEFCHRHGLWLVEDAAEAHGAEYRGKRVGAFGDVGCFSFFANKIITTGEGGMLVSDNAEIAMHSRQFRSLAFGEIDRFQHAGLGFNYRMTNIQAALGVAQMDRIESNIIDKRRIAQRYERNLVGLEGLRLPVERADIRNVYWMYHVVLEGDWEGRRDEVRAALFRDGIETRQSFVPFDQQDAFIEQGLVRRGECPVAGVIGANGFYLPSGPQLEESTVDFISDRLRSVMGESR
jgi:perosamine synthetase